MRSFPGRSRRRCSYRMPPNEAPRIFEGPIHPTSWKKERSANFALKLSEKSRRWPNRDLTADCIDTDPPAGRGYSGQSGKTLIEIAHVHHAMRVMFTETRCRTKKSPQRAQYWAL